MVDEELTPGERPSKSQRKRELAALRDVGERLLSVPEEQLHRLDNPELVEAVLECKRITKGNARKRQLQYIGKLLRTDSGEVAETVIEMLDRMEAGTKAHNAQFHKLEQWRERLLDDDEETRNQALGDVMDTHPDLDRQHFRHLVKNALDEKRAGREPPVHFRKLFKFLRSLVED